MITTKRILEYTDKEKIGLRFSVLILNVKSINKKYGELDDFVNEFNLWGETNGKIYALSEMQQPPCELIEFIDIHLKPHGFENITDYVIAYDRLTPNLDKFAEPEDIEIPECKHVKWLTTFKNDVWSKNPNEYTIPQIDIECYKMSADMWTRVLRTYFNNVYPDELHQKPAVIKVKEDHLFFGMLGDVDDYRIDIAKLKPYIEEAFSI